MNQPMMAVADGCEIIWMICTALGHRQNMMKMQPAGLGTAF